MLGPGPLLAALLAVVALAIAGCGGGKGPDRSEDDPAPAIGVAGDEGDAAEDLGFPLFATRNTTRVGGRDPIADAAAVARAAHPATDRSTRPKAVALVDAGHWQAGLAAAALAADPIGAPVLLADGDELPEATRATLQALAPTGSREAGGAQVIRIGDVPRVDGFATTDVTGTDGAAIAARIDAMLSAARGVTSDHLVIVSSERPELALPAAGWAAKSGDPILFTERDRLPAATREAIMRHQQPRIYILGSRRVVSARVERELRRLGTVKRIDGGDDPVRNAIAFARYLDGAFGWGVVDPGHGLVFVNAARPLDAVAAAPLSGGGTYGPILVHTGGDRLPAALESYLLDIQPGYRRDPVRGVYNHGWILGDEDAMPAAVQARIDALLEIRPVETDRDSETPSS
jgi:hypothetical protein